SDPGDGEASFGWRCAVTVAIGAPGRQSPARAGLIRQADERFPILVRPEDLNFKPEHPLDPDEVMDRLDLVSYSGSADEIAAAVRDAFYVGLSEECVMTLIPLLARRDHYVHEDIVRALQELKDPRAVDAIYAAALVEHGYLAGDEFFGL